MDTTTWVSLGIIAVSVVVIGLVLYRGSRKTRRVVADQAAREEAVERMAAPAGPASGPPDVPVAAVDAPVPAAAQGSAEPSSGALAGPAAGEVEVPLEVEVTNLKRGESGPKGT